MFFNLHRLLRQLFHFGVGQREAIPLLLRHIFNGDLLAMLLRRSIDHADFFRAHGAAYHCRTVSRQRRLVHVEFVRVHRPLHHHLAQTPCGGDKHHLVEAGFSVDREHHAGRAYVGTHHALYACGERHAAVVIPLMHAIGDGAVVEQGSKHMLHRHQHRLVTLDVEEGFLLPGERGIRHIFCCSGRAHGKGGLRIVSGELVVRVVNGFFQFRLERCVDNPLADLRAGFGKLGDIINIRFIQQVVNALVYTALV